MFRVVKEWTKGQPLLRVAEVPSASESFPKFILADRKEWAIRAIRDRFTVLSDEELAYFLNLAGNITYAYFKMAELNKAYYMRIATAATNNIDLKHGI